MFTNCAAYAYVQELAAAVVAGSGSSSNSDSHSGSKVGDSGSSVVLYAPQDCCSGSTATCKLQVLSASELLTQLQLLLIAAAASK